MAVNPTPNVPQRGKVSTSMYVRAARPDVIQANRNELDRSQIATLFFEQMAGTEILLTSRQYLVNGINVEYTPFSDLRDISIEFSSNKIIPLPASSQEAFVGFAIDFQSHIPTTGSGPNDEYLYIDDSTGDLIIEVDNILDDEEVEVEIFAAPTVYADTVYNDIGES